jgi:NADH-quinone oxidoreductase subunit J
LSPTLAVFYLLAAITLGSAVAVVSSRNVVYAVLALLLSLVAVAGLFILLLAEFLALVQVLIYAGAIIIVLLFALMLTRVEEFDRVRDNPQRPIALVVAGAVLGILIAAFLRFSPVTQELKHVGVTALGSELFTRWAIPFEVASLVLLVALIGAIVIARAGGRE